jgi:hypothetical protein
LPIEEKAEEKSYLRLFKSAIGNRKSEMPLLVLVYVHVLSVNHVVFAA